ncbi:MAG: hypothetical protein M3416_19605, partial [Acidobacteriota bacterium]|nr:hypothetical protein [Acidobacteriota bacterium]
VAEGPRTQNRGGDNKHADGPGNQGRGHAHGHDKHDAGKPARVHEIENQVQQVRSRIENLTKTQQPPGAERLGDDLPGRDRGRDVTQTRGNDGYADDGEVRFRSRTDDDRARVGENDRDDGDRTRFSHHDDDGGRRSRFDEADGGRGRRYGEGDDDHGRWRSDHEGGRRGRSDDGDDGWHFRNYERSSRGDNWRLDNPGPGNQGRGHAHGHDKHSSHGPPLDTLTNTAAGTLARSSGALAEVVRDLGHTLKHTSRPLLESAAAYLRGQTDGADLPPDTRAALRTAADTLGPEFVSQLDGRHADKVFKVVERALEHLNRAVEHARQHGESFVRLPDGGRLPLEQAARTLGRAAAAPEQFVREMVDELLGAVLLNRHLKHLEKTGGHVVQQAEAKIAHTLYGTPPEAARPPVFHPGGGQQPAPFAPQPRPHPQEILRDLRGGAFLPPQEQYNPFPLTGRARVAAEMMELMRTLDAVEGALQRAAARAGETQRANAEASFVAWLKGGMAAGADGALEELLSLVLPALPGRAARWEIPRLVAELHGLLTDAEGRALLARDGTPLKLDRLLWLGAAGGLLGSLFGSSFEGEHAPARLSPLVVYGFDAIYTVVGFDGRTLASPHFVAVQSAVNNSEFEWVFGHEPFTDGWVRELIERLKDSAVVEHNLLGEMLEEALNDGRFHVALLSVEVEEGAPVREATTVTRLLPGAGGAVAFA